MAATKLIESARRRLHIQTLFSQALVALSIGAAGLVLLLILGTQVLDWYWPVLLAVVSFGLLVHRVWNKLPNAYQSAQILDQRLATFDLFSTAHHFRSQPRTRLTETLIETADSAASTFNASDAIPFKMPSGWVRAAALAVVALSLLVFRYAFQSSLDLSSPIAPGMYQLLASGEKPTQMAKARNQQPNGQPLDGFGLNDARQQNDQQKTIEKGQELNSESANSTESASAGQKPGQFQESMAPSEEGEKMEGAEKGDSSAAGDKGDKGDKDGDKKSSASAADKKSGSQQNQGGQQGDKSSLLDKFKDAMANMMNKMKSQDKSEGQQQQAQNKQDGQQGNGQQQQQANKGQQAQGQQQANGQQQSDQNSQQQGEGGEKSPNQQAKGGDKSNQSPSGDQKSGMGKQDGSKDVQLAEQQRAMGKISEVFGKRAQNLQGEVMIEVSSSKSQALKTNYSGKSAAHSDTSGVIQRDEVPLIHQNYVQRYFEELRKSPPPPPKTTP
ncbi:MAG: hypothetical protein FJW36_19835 [Acidobacteria bacterium]|nr:hypothetical protein [Acidobacteriota bacterium]